MKILGTVPREVAIWAHLRDHACLQIPGASGSLIDKPDFASPSENRSRFDLLARCRPAHAALLSNQHVAEIRLEMADVRTAHSCWELGPQLLLTLDQIATPLLEVEKGSITTTFFGKDAGTAQKIREIINTLADRFQKAEKLIDHTDWWRDPSPVLDIHRTLWIRSPALPAVLQVRDGMHRMIAIYSAYCIEHTGSFPELRAMFVC